MYVCIYIYINLKEGYRFLPYQIKGKRYLKKSLLEDMFIDFREGGGRERKRNICTPTRYGTCNILVCGTTLQPTESPGQGGKRYFLVYT